MKVFDVIVAGMGPAGSSAARAAAEAGASVLALERASHPRKKLCGGGLSSRVLPLLPPGSERIIESAICKAVLKHRERVFSMTYHRPFAYVIRRPLFDAHLASEARRAGVVVHEEEEVRAIRERSGFVEVTTGRGTYRAKYLIGADGAHSAVARALRVSLGLRPIAGVPALEAVLGGTFDRSTIYIDVSTVAWGYGWAFPNACGASVGIGVFDESPRKVGHLRRLFSTFAAETLRKWGGEVGRPPSAEGHPIPVHRILRRPPATGRILLAGDAAGLADPFFGEGIYQALFSGRLAGEAAAYGRPQEYPRRLEPLIADLRTAARVAQAVYRFPRLCSLLLGRSPEAAEPFFDFLCGGKSFSTAVGEIRKRGALALVSGLLPSGRAIRSGT